MAAKPNPEMDERVTIPLDPETALRQLMKVAPNDKTQDSGAPSEGSKEPIEKR